MGDNQIAAQPSKPRQRVILNIRDQIAAIFRVPGTMGYRHQAA
jgi:hypothetical protein